MKKFLLTVVFAALLAVPMAFAQSSTTLTLPSVTFTAPIVASTGINCVQTAASNLVVPVAAGTVIFSCTVAPSNWVGTIPAALNAPFAVSGLTGNTFNVVVSTTVTAAGTVAPGSVSASP